MTNFPDIPLDVRPELLINGTWTDVSAYQDHGPVGIGRGHPDESTKVSPSTLALTLTNTDARFSSKNPTSPYYPYLVRNTPCRVSIPAQSNYLRLENNAQDRAFVNDTSTLHITGSIELRIQVALTDWQGCILAARWDTGASWVWNLNPDGTLTFTWEDSGAGQHSVTSTVPVPLAPGAAALRVTMDATTGNVTFSTSATIGGSFTTLGTVQSGTGGAATSIASSNSPLVVGYSFIVDPQEQLCGRVYEFRMYNGIAGTVAADAVFSAQAAGVTSFSDAQGNTWLLGGGAEVSSRDYRIHAEVPEWPQHQDPTGKTWTVSAAGGGLLRRLSQRNNAVNSAMWRAWVKTGASLAAYHPMEDGAGAQSLASGIGGPAAQFSGVLQLAQNSDFASSASLPVLNGTVIVGRVPSYSPGWSGNQVSWLTEIPSGGEANGSEILRVATTGTVAQVVITYGTGGSAAITGYDSSGTQLFTSGATLFGPGGTGVNGLQLLWWLSLTQSGGNVAWELAAVAPDAALAQAVTGTLSTATTGAVTSWTMNGGGQLLQTVAGHVAVQATTGDLTALGGPLNAWQGEAAGTRFARLCSEEGIPFRAGGHLGKTTLMGVQSRQTLTQLLQECADADRGVWYELKQQLGWGYVPRAALYNQPAAVTVTYATDMLGEWASDPTEDDKDVRNDETVSQTTGGGSARQFAAPGQAVSGGRLSAQSPPSGSGTYDGSDSLNVWRVTDLPSLAAWIAHVGTVDEPRYPGIVLDLSNRGLASLFYAILALELGQRLTISSPPAQLGPDTISQLAWQLSEELWGDTLKITMAGTPSRPYLIAREGATTGRADTDGSALAQAVTSGATTLPVTVTGASGIAWSQDPLDCPFDIAAGGERMTVTAVTPQGTDPGNFEAGVSNWFANNGTLVQSGAQHRSGSFSAQVTATSTSVAQLLPNPAVRAQVIPGQSYTVSGWVLAAQSGCTFSAQVNWYDASGAFISGTGAPFTAPPATFTWTPVTWTATAPAGAAFAGYGTQMTPAAGGNWYYSDDVTLLGPNVLSVALADGTFETGVSQWTPGNATVVQSGAQHHSGSFSAQVTSNSSSASAFLRPSVSGFYVPVIPGQPYTCTLWVLAGQGGCTFGAVIDWYGPGTGNYISSSNGPTSSPGAFTWTQYTVTGTAPAGATFARYGPTMAITTSGNYYYCDDVGFFAYGQQFDVTRSVNGVAKAQAAGTAVALWDTPVAAL